MSRKRISRFVAATLVACAATLVARQDGTVIRSGGTSNVDWPIYRGDAKGNQYSPLAQIHAANVHRLERAWAYKTLNTAPGDVISITAEAGSTPRFCENMLIIASRVNESYDASPGHIRGYDTYDETALGRAAELRTAGSNLCR